MSDLQEKIIELGFQLFSIKLYWVAASAWWFYEYFLTFDDEVNYAWKGRKTPVFWLFILASSPDWVISNAANVPRRIAISLPATFRYGFMETFETVTLTTTAQLFIALRVYAITAKHQLFPAFTILVLLAQWGIAIYAMSQSSLGTDQVALLLPVRRDIDSSVAATIPALPVLPTIDPYHICIFISTLTVTPYVKAFLGLALAYDTIAFLVIFGVTLRRQRSYKLLPIIQVIQRDGIMYFLILFSSNLLWVLLIQYAPPALKFLHNQPAMLVSSVMITRITLNLKKASQSQTVISWGVHTFEATPWQALGSNATELSTFRAARKRSNNEGSETMY
ncbi:unnamed protein product [Mycena citricolor]|uniref:DUF6533 domain-containing protein n=1 Tax=Mycena citricolor TaxID=2018698 RepID=A0AAD2HHP4_9AGAR|nr:unnamed protein product [Mycena citricolor]